MVNSQCIDSVRAIEIANRYVSSGGNVCIIKGSLLDNYILYGKSTEVYVIREVALNEWSSCLRLFEYTYLPKKYKEVINLMNAGKTRLAEKKFFE